MLSRKKKTIFFIFTGFLALIMILVLSELVLRLSGYKYEYKYLSALDYAIVADKRHCTWNESLYPHPYYGFIQKKDLPCSMGKVNSHGFISPEFPEQKNEKYFDILVMGGSVAAQLIGGIGFQLDGHLFKKLNENFIDSRGREVRVFSTATGAWKQPQQINSYLVFGDVFDAVISIEGANETGQFSPNEQFERPFGIYWGIASYPDVDVDRLVKRVSSMKRLQRRFEFLNKSVIYQTLLLNVAENASKKFNELFYKSWSHKSFVKKSTVEREQNNEKYLGYVKKLSLLTKNANQKFITFIQPILHYNKKIHSKEKLIPENTNQTKSYALLVKRLKDKPVENITLLSDIFENINDHMYIDYVHFDFHMNNKNAPNGHEIISKKIAEELIQKWGLKPKK